MGKISQTIKGYIWWMYPRGSVHYDVMVTLILAFIFLTPLWINFRDKPVERSPHQTEVVVKPEGNGFIYTVDAASIKPGGDEEVREALLRPRRHRGARHRHGVKAERRCLCRERRLDVVRRRQKSRSA